MKCKECETWREAIKEYKQRQNEKENAFWFIIAILAMLSIVFIIF
jgi:hypothetical protein